MWLTRIMTLESAEVGQPFSVCPRHMPCTSDVAALFMQAHLTLCQEPCAGQLCGVCTVPEGLCSLGSSQGSSRLLGRAGEHHLQSKKSKS